MNRSKSSVALSVALLAGSMLSACGDGRDAQVPTEVPKPPPPSQTGPRAAPVAVPDSEAIALPIGQGRAQPLQLKAGQTAIGTLVAPKAGKLVAFDVKLGNYFNSSTGLLKLELCKGKEGECTEGSGDLLTSVDNGMFTIVLDEPLEVAADEGLSFQLRKEGGDKDVVVWTYPSTSGDAQAISREEGRAIEGRTASLALRFAK